ncbi:hypothetical protein QWZ13_04175 [Reinekea marina]|nr:hypothetical protein [Reinekea marina]MDN3648100.1 hypothetical protein [Reinekea marina]
MPRKIYPIKSNNKHKFIIRKETCRMTLGQTIMLALVPLLAA